jgi:hypothetical protein
MYLKIFDEKLKWRSESRIKPIFESEDLNNNNNDAISHRSTKVYINEIKKAQLFD